MTEIAKIWVPIAGETTGLANDIVRAVRSATSQISGGSSGLSRALGAEGVRAGRAAGDGIARGVAAAAGKVEAAARQIEKARAAEAEAAGRVRVAEQQLASLRQRGVTDTGRIAQAEERLNSARRNVTSTADDTARATAGLTAAQEAQTAALAAQAQAAEDAANANSDAGDAAEETGGRFEGMGGRLEGVTSKLKNFAVLAAGGLGIAGIAQQFSASITLGMDFTETLNTMAAVSGATASEMDRVTVAAKDLGQSADLPTASASDAAAAMTELAKGGLDVQESMDAARGSLALAAAAGTDAATAATIQANTLNTFGLAAGDATRVADVLSNASNASTAEIGDVAYAMQAGGSVAKQYGLSIEDTAASIAMFANNGISGSDAGTLLKSSLAAMTVGSAPAAEAVDKLGLTLHDAEGKFVGMSSLMDQLGEAAKGMTDEQYAAATETLFGRDAMRFAGIAASEGSKQFDEMRVAMDRQGSAAEIAAAKTKGLPGAWSQFTNALEGVQLALFEKIDKPLQAILGGLSTGIGALPGIVGGIVTALEKVGAVLGTIGGAFESAFGFMVEHKDIFGPIGVAVGVFAATIAAGLIPALVTWAATMVKVNVQVAAYLVKQAILTTATRVAAAAQWLFNAALTANPIGLVVAAIAGLVAGLVYFFTKTETGRKIWAKVWDAIKAATSAVVDWFTGTALPAITGFFSKIGDVAMWLWNSAIKPAFNGMKKVIGLWWAGVKVYFGLLKTTLTTLGTAVMWFWNSVIVPAFNGIKAAISLWWSGVQVYWDLFKAALSLIGDTLSWLWNTIAVPAFEGIKSAASLMWEGIKVIWDLFKAGLELIGNALSWLWNTVAVPAFDGIKAAASLMWDGISAIWDLFKAGLDLVGNALNWLWNTVAVPAFNGIKTAAELMWSGVTQIFDWLKAGVDAIGTALGTIKDVASTAFTALGDAVTAVWSVVEGPLTSIKDFIADIIEKAKSLTDLPGKIKDTLGSIPGASILPGLATGGIAGYASGGSPIKGGVLDGPGTGTSDSILVRLSKGEYIINAKQTAKNMALLAAINGGWTPSDDQLAALPAYKTGGVTGGAQRAIDYANSMVGTGYQMGGFGPGGIDCSGFVAAVVNSALGKDPYDSRMSTPSEGSWLSSLGATSGLGPEGSLRIGWWDGGTGGFSNGHTAGTLPDGTNFESTGNGGVILGGDVGADDAQFTNQMHFPPEMIGGELQSLSSGATGGGSTVTGSGGTTGGGTTTGSGLPSRGTVAAERQQRDAAQKVDDKQFALDQAKAKQAELEAKDQSTVTDSQRAAAKERVAKAERELEDAKTDSATADARLEEARQKDTESGTTETGTADASSDTPDMGELGKIFGGGLLETFGLDGSFLSNPMEWPLVKMFTGLLGSFTGGTGADAGGLGGGLLSAIAPDLATGTSDGTAEPFNNQGTAGADGSGALVEAAGSILTDATDATRDSMLGQTTPGAVDQSINFNGNVGMNPVDVKSKMDQERNSRSRTYGGIR